MSAKRDYLYGIAPCLSALLAKRRHIFKVYMNKKYIEEAPFRKEFNEVLRISKERNINVIYKSSMILDRLTQSRPHQNLVVVASKLNPESITRDSYSHPKGKSFLLALDSIQDPMNMGTIIRSATYFGVDKIIVENKNSCALSPVVSKVSAGALELSPIATTNSIQRFLKDTLKHGWQVIGAVASKNSIPCDEIQLSEKAVLVLGNEGCGIRNSVLDICTDFVAIQPPSSISQEIRLDSLNVSVATGILLHAFLRYRPTT